MPSGGERQLPDADQCCMVHADSADGVSGLQQEAFEFCDESCFAALGDARGSPAASHGLCC